MAGNTSLDTGINDDGKVNKECLEYVLGKFSLKLNTHDGSWSKELWIQLQARMATHTSDYPKVSTLQCGFCRAWLQVLGLKKDILSSLMTLAKLLSWTTDPYYLLTLGHQTKHFQMMPTMDILHVTCHLLLKGSGPNSCICKGSKIFLTPGGISALPVQVT